MARPFLVPFRRLLRLAGSRWRYSTPPPHGFVAVRLLCFLLFFTHDHYFFKWLHPWKTTPTLFSLLILVHSGHQSWFSLSLYQYHHFLYSEDGNSGFLQHVSKNLAVHIASRPRRQQYSHTHTCHCENVTPHIYSSTSNGMSLRVCHSLSGK
jgi:hypothetical protein